jgi:putative SbcD/Mre11-related phosphoesterase
MKLTENIEIRDLSLWFKKQKILVITDLHIGLEEAMNKQGFLVPRFQMKELAKKLEKILETIKPKKIIILGDLKHEFGQISKQEWFDTLKILDFLLRKSEEVILLKGNHDTILGPIAEKKNVKLVPYHFEDEYYFAHGDKIPEDDDFKKAKYLIIGHEHPAISVRTEFRSEKYKCFIYGKYEDKKLIVVPSFNLVNEGTDLLKEHLLSPILKKCNLDEFDVFIVEDKAYDFGKFKKLKSM